MNGQYRSQNKFFNNKLRNEDIRNPGNVCPILSMTYNGPNQTLSNNVHQWQNFHLSCSIEGTDAGIFARRVVENKEFDEERCAPEDNLNLYPIRTLLSTTMECFITTEQQDVEIDQCRNAVDKARLTKRFYVEWKAAQEVINLEITTSNLDNSEKRKVHAKRKLERITSLTGIISTLLKSMSTNSREKVEAYTREFTDREMERRINELAFADDGITLLQRYGIKHARVRGDFWFIFQASYETHVTRLASSGEDKVSKLRRGNQALESLKSCKYVRGDFLTWSRVFRENLDAVIACGKAIDEFELCEIYVQCLNPKIFQSFITEWESTNMRNLMNVNSFKELEDYVFIQYSNMQTNHIEVVRQVEMLQPRAQLSLTIKHQDKSHGADKERQERCPICRRNNHGAEDCFYNNPQYTLEQNIEYNKRRVNKRDHNDDKGDPKKAKLNHVKAEEVNMLSEETQDTEDIPVAPTPRKTGGNFTSGSGSTADKKSANPSKKIDVYPILPFSTNYLSFADLIEPEQILNCDDDSVLLCNIIHVMPKRVDLVFDTGSEANTIDPSSAGILSNIHREESRLEGFGGAISKSSHVGYNTFGKTRIVDVPKCLIAQEEAEINYRIVQKIRGQLILRGWDNDCEWYFNRDPDRYGDRLLHLILEGDELRRFVESGRTPLKVFNSFYRPKKSPDLFKFNESEREILQRVQEIHSTFNHISGQGILRMLDSNQSISTQFDITKEEVRFWMENLGKFCVGCLIGKMKEHNRVPSSQPKVYVIGRTATADLMFIDQVRGGKKPFFLLVDMGCKFMIGVPMSSKEEKEVLRVIKYCAGLYVSYGHRLMELIFDRESAVVSGAGDIITDGIRVILTAGGQKAATAEQSISKVRDSVRSTRAGVLEDFKYHVPVQFAENYCMDAIATRNKTILEGYDKSPYEQFTGRVVPLEKCMRVRLGEIIIAKKPKGLASDLHSTARWAIVVRRYMEGTGVICVYILETKKYAHILKFERPTVPDYILKQAQSLNLQAISLGYEDSPWDIHQLEEETSEDYPISLDAGVGARLSADPDSLTEDEIQHLMDVHETVTDEILPLQQSGELSSSESFYAIPEDNPLYDSTGDSFLEDPRTSNDEEENEYINQERAGEFLQGMIYESETGESGYIPPDAQASREVRDLQKSWMTAPISRKRVPTMREKYVYNVYSLLFSEAMTTHPVQASDALDKELASMRTNHAYGGTRIEWLTAEQQKLVLPMMLNFVIKYHPDGELDKFKVRVLARGDLQYDNGETEGPVCRVETIFMIFTFAAYYNLKVFVIDFVSAYLNTPMPEEVKHRWLLLDKTVSRRLMLQDPEYWRQFLRRDGKILVEMHKLIYGYKEAAHYWNKILIAMFVEHGWTVSKKDVCFLFKQTADTIAMIGITVDDCLCAITDGHGIKEEIVAMCESTFSAITITEGDTINVIGMRFTMDRARGAVKIDQRKFVNKTVLRFGSEKKSKLPYLQDLFKDEEDSPLLEDQLNYMAITSTNMFGAKRTYPEILSAVTTGAEKYGKATEKDYKAQVKVVDYLNDTKDYHCLYIRPKRLRIRASSDASWAESTDAKSRTGGCIGFEGYDGEGAYFMFISQKQSIVAKSSCEAELIALDTVASHVEYLMQMCEELGPAFVSEHPAIIEQDNTSTMQIATAGKGTFKRSKHINVRFFWVSQMIKAGRQLLTYTSTLLLVADILTKPVARERFFALINRLLGWTSMPGGGPEIPDDGLNSETDHGEKEENTPHQDFNMPNH